MDAAYSAFCDAYARGFGPMVRSLRRRGYGDHAEDVVQESWAALWRSRERYEWDRDMLPLAWGYLNNRTYKSRRSRARRPEVLVEDFPVTAAADDPAAEACTRVALQEVGASLDAMPALESGCIRLSAADWLRADIAEEYGVTRRQVVRALDSGRRRLRCRYSL